MKMLLVAILSLGFTSCMHMGMLGSGGGHHTSTSSAITTGSVVEKEVVADGVKAVALFPPLEYDKVIAVELKLMDVETSEPVLEAEVNFRAQSTRVKHHNDDKTLSEYDTADSQDIMEGPAPGSYTAFYRPTQAGEHTLKFCITAAGGQDLARPIVVGAVRTLPQTGHKHADGMMGRTDLTTPVIVGVASMGAMMFFMLAMGNGMF